MTRLSARLGAPLLALALVLAIAPAVPAAPEGTMTWGVHITLASRWLDPAETEGIITPFDPQKAKQLLAEAGYPNGFDAGDFYPWPPYFSMGEALAGYLQNVGIRTKIRTMERASMTAAWRDRKLKNVIIGITGAGGNAATRLEAYVSKGGIYTSGVMPDVEDLFQRQAREADVKKREALLHQIQQILHDRVTQIPIYELAFIWGVHPRVEEPGVNLIRSFAYSAPLEDLRLKKQ